MDDIHWDLHQKKTDHQVFSPVTQEVGGHLEREGLPRPLFQPLASEKPSRARRHLPLWRMSSILPRCRVWCLDVRDLRSCEWTRTLEIVCFFWGGWVLIGHIRCHLLFQFFLSEGATGAYEVLSLHPTWTGCSAWHGKRAQGYLEQDEVWIPMVGCMTTITTYTYIHHLLTVAHVVFFAWMWRVVCRHTVLVKWVHLQSTPIRLA